MSVSFCLSHPVAVSAFMICRGLCACTEMLWMCVLYVSFGSKVRPRTFGCVAMGSALLFIVRSRLLIYSAGSGVNRVQVVLSGFSKSLFCFVQAKTLCRYGCMYFLAAHRVRFRSDHHIHQHTHCQQNFHKHLTDGRQAEHTKGQDA